MWGRALAAAGAAGAVAALAACSSTPPVENNTSHARSSSPWSLVSPPSPGTQSLLDSVACSSATSCEAVGSYSAAGVSVHALAESWDGTSWSVDSSPSPGTDTELLSVACTARASCMAVGVTGSPGGRRAFAELRRGSSWAVVPVPTPGSPSALQAVVCAAPNSCTAVGSSSTSTSALPAALVESWDGNRWSVVQTPSAAGSVESELNSVACASSTTCMAVGTFNTTGDIEDQENFTLVEAWNGTSWSVVPSPNPGILSGFVSIACPSPTACIAVGAYSPTADPYVADDQSFVEAWGGTQWSIVPSPRLGARYVSALQAAACASPDRCLAVGYSALRARPGEHRHLIESWDGSSWSVAAGPATNGVLKTVACPSTTSCIAVGAGAAGRALVAWWRWT